MKRSSYKRRCLLIMYEIFAELNTIPHEVRKKWGKFGYWADYAFALAEINKEIQRLDANLRSANHMNREVSSQTSNGHAEVV